MESINKSVLYHDNVTLSTNDDIIISGYERFVTVLQTTVIAVISSGIILSNIINLIVLASASAAMPWSTRLFLINLSSSDLLVGLVACAPAVLPAATGRWTYAELPSLLFPDETDYLHTGVLIGDGQVDIRCGLVPGIWSYSRHVMCCLYLEHSDDRSTQVLTLHLTDLNLYTELKGHWRLFVLVSSFYIFWLRVLD